jgi:hypothetical protein
MHCCWVLDLARIFPLLSISSLVSFSSVALDSEISCILEFKANKLKKLIFIQEFHEIEINEAVVKV